MATHQGGVFATTLGGAQTGTAFRHREGLAET